MLRLEKLCCGYGPMQAVHGIDLEAAAGRVMALLGANGAGKSSTLMCIAGHVEIQAGQISYKGGDIALKTPMERVAAGIGLVPEGRRLFTELTVRENLVVGGYCRARHKTAPNMEKILGLFPRLGERIDQRAGALSGGEQQRVAVARALINEPSVILADEPSGNLDRQNKEELHKMFFSLRDNFKQTFVIVTHDNELAQMADRMLTIKDGIIEVN